MTTIRVNTVNNAITQYDKCNFTSFCMFQGKPLACGPDGIFQLEIGHQDAYTADTDERDVDAWFELPISNFGEDLIKRGRRLLVNGKMTGEMLVTATTFDNTETIETFNIIPRSKIMIQHTMQVQLSHKQQSEQWKFLFENVKGSDFSIDSVDGIFVPVNRRLGL